MEKSETVFGKPSKVPANPEEFAGESLDIGKTVFPVDKIEDVIDHRAILLSHADTYVGRVLAKFLRTQSPGDALRLNDDGEGGGAAEDDEVPEYAGNKKNQWKLIGTLKDEKGPDPEYLWATVVYDDFEAYLEEVVKCRCVIYDVTDDPTPERMREIRLVCDTLFANASKFNSPRTFILISSLHSWSHTEKPKNDRGFRFTDDNYRHRRTSQKYRDLQLLERHVVASGKNSNGMVKAFVIGAGAIYGDGEDPLHAHFKAAWHNAPYLCVYGKGDNFVPTVYHKDLARIVQNVIDRPPRLQRYIVAVDPRISTQEEIARAISGALSSGDIKKVPESDVYLNQELSAFQADQLVLNVPIEPALVKEKFAIRWTAQKGFASIIDLVVQEYRNARGLLPVKIVFAGPPGSGKSLVARQISDMYHIHHFEAHTFVGSTIKYMRDLVGSSEETSKRAEALEEEAEFEGEQEFETSNGQNPRAREAKSLLAKIDSLPDKLVSSGRVGPAMFARLVRFRLDSNAIRNQGYILDGFPITYEDAVNYFQAGKAGRRGSKAELGPEDSDGDMEDPETLALETSWVPDYTFIFEAPEDLIKERLAAAPVDTLELRHTQPKFNEVYQNYMELQANYKDTLVAFLNENDLPYETFDVAKDCSRNMRETTAKIVDVLGKPRNYGLTIEEETALKFAQKCSLEEAERRKLEEFLCVKERLVEARRNNINDWMQKLARVKREEFEKEEAALTPLRNYLMAQVVPTLTKGLMELGRMKPEDPVDYLSEYLFQNNPGGINPTVDNSNLC